MVNQRSVADLEQAIRTFITQPRRQRRLMAKPIRYNVICASLDLLADTQLALGAYLSAKAQADPGALYLAHYGALQALFLQQDAIVHLGAQLEVPVSLDAELQEIREARNDAIGHPALREKAKTSSSIVRGSMGSTSFQTFRWRPDGHYDSRRIDVEKSVAIQQDKLSILLETILAKLKQDEAGHRAQFKAERLSACFHKSTDYMLAKVDEGIADSASRPFGAASLASVEEMLSKLRVQLHAREEWSDDAPVAYLFGETVGPLDALRKFLNADPDACSSEVAGWASHFLRDKIRELRQMAEEIDADYASEP